MATRARPTAMLNRMAAASGSFINFLLVTDAWASRTRALAGESSCACLSMIFRRSAGRAFHAARFMTTISAVETSRVDHDAELVGQELAAGPLGRRGRISAIGDRIVESVLNARRT